MSRCNRLVVVAWLSVKLIGFQSNLDSIKSVDNVFCAKKCRLWFWERSVSRWRVKDGLVVGGLII